MAVDHDTTGRFRYEPEDKDASPGLRSEGVLTVLRGPCPGFVFTLDAPRTVIGRAADASIVLGDEGVSREHAEIERQGQGFVIRDLGSTNGTFVDGDVIVGQLPLKDGQRIMLGGTTALRFTLHDHIEQDAARMTQELAVRDPLTRLYNRRHLGERLDAEVAFAKRHRQPLSVLLVDVDGFKGINDSYGHDAGDDILTRLATTLQGAVRQEDLLARYGGEEFVVVARGIDREGTIALGERIRIAALEMRSDDDRFPPRITVSVGIAYADCGKASAPHKMLRMADLALYAAKSGGRNRVVEHATLDDH